MSTGKYNAIRLKEFEGRKTVVCSNHVHVRGEVFYINSQLCLNSPLRLGFRGCKPRTTVMSLSQMLRTTREQAGLLKSIEECLLNYLTIALSSPETSASSQGSHRSSRVL